MSSTQKTIDFSSRRRYFPSRCQKSLAMTRRAVGQAYVALEVRRRVPLAVGADVALLVEVRDPLVEQVRNEVPVFDRLLQRVRVRGVAEVLEGVAPALLVGEVPVAFNLPRRSGQAELIRLSVVLEHAEPIPEARAVALVHDDQPEEVRIEVLEQLLAVKLFVEVLVVGEEDLADLMFAPCHDVLVQHHPLVRIEGRERAVCLILEAVPVGQEENAVAGKDTSRQELPHELEDGKGLAGTGRHEQQKPLFVLREAVKRLEDRHLLVRTDPLAGNLILVPRRFEYGAPHTPDDVPTHQAQDVAGRRRRLEALVLSRLVVGEDILLAVARDGETKTQALRVPRPLLHSVRRRLAFALRLQDGERHPPQPQQVIGNDPLRRVIHRLARQVDGAGANLDLSVPAPPGIAKGGLDQLTTSLCLVAAHGIGFLPITTQDPCHHQPTPYLDSQLVRVR